MENKHCPVISSKGDLRNNQCAPQLPWFMQEYKFDQRNKRSPYSSLYRLMDQSRNDVAGGVEDWFILRLVQLLIVRRMQEIKFVDSFSQYRSKKTRLRSLRKRIWIRLLGEECSPVALDLWSVRSWNPNTGNQVLLHWLSDERSDRTYEHGGRNCATDFCNSQLDDRSLRIRFSETMSTNWTAYHHDNPTNKLGPQDRAKVRSSKCIDSIRVEALNDAAN